MSEQARNNAVQNTLFEIYDAVKQVILSRQNPITGLFPASSDINHHGDYTDAWVRDNIYSIQAVWGLRQAFKARTGCDGERIELENAIIKLMRGLLIAMMKQADKVECFKKNPTPMNALHAKYDTGTGDIVVGDAQWGHLQLDATAIFLLMLARMSREEISIIYTIDEVNFVQNLVYYIGRAYRTPDYGIWERGHKLNQGKVELNASSIGMVRSALIELDGVNLFGRHGNESSVIHVVEDEIARTSIRLASLLPKESQSKETDASLLSIIGYPAFAIDDAVLYEKTRQAVLVKLQGRYGLKRFLLDGHQSVLEDTSRLHYEESELYKFEHTEAEWPLFFCYLYLDALFRGNVEEVDFYRHKLEQVAIEKSGAKLLPELYYVQKKDIDAEKIKPGSVCRTANKNLPLIWAQSLWYLGQLIDQELVQPEQLLSHSVAFTADKQIETSVKIALLVDNEKGHEYFSKKALLCEVVDKLDCVDILPSNALADVFFQLGSNEKLKLSGRPKRRIRTLMTAKVYQFGTKKVVFTPSFMDCNNSYLALDNRLLIEQLQSELHYIKRYWRSDETPIIVLHFDDAMLSDPAIEKFVSTLSAMIENKEYAIEIEKLSRFAPLANPVPMDRQLTSLLKKDAENIMSITTVKDKSAKNNLYYLQDTEQFTQVNALIKSYEQAPRLEEKMGFLLALKKKLGPEQSLTVRGDSVTLAQLLHRLLKEAKQQRNWLVIRMVSGATGQHFEDIEEALTEIIARNHQVVVGRACRSYSTFDATQNSDSIVAVIKQHSGDGYLEVMLNQEVMCYVALLLRKNHSLFDAMLSIRTTYLLHLCVVDIARHMQVTPDVALNKLGAESPSQVLGRIESALVSYQAASMALIQFDLLHYFSESERCALASFDERMDPEKNADDSWLDWRRKSGIITRLSEDYYKDVWHLLKHCKGLVLGDRFTKGSRIEKETIHGSMTQYENSFMLFIEDKLNQITSPEYRQLSIEVLVTVIHFMKLNPSVTFNDYLVIEVLLCHAVRLHWLSLYPAQEENYEQHRSEAWNRFFLLAPHKTAQCIQHALHSLLTFELPDNSSSNQ